MDFKILAISDKKLLGSGGFGEVLLTELTVTYDNKTIFTVPMAKKVVRKAKVSGEENEINLRYLLQEHEISKNLSSKNPFLSSLILSYSDENNFYMLSELHLGGNLWEWSYCNPKLRDLTSLSLIAAEILLGLSYLHEKGIFHRDLKLDNVMIANNGHLRIVDFGLCKVTKRLTRFEPVFEFSREIYPGTLIYKSPEFFYKEELTQSIDLWALGVMLYYMYTGHFPFEKNSLEFVLKPISYAEFDRKDIIFTDFVNRLLQLPVSRFSTTNVASGHKLFQNIDWSKVFRQEYRPPVCVSIPNIEDVGREIVYEKPNNKRFVYNIDLKDRVEAFNFNFNHI